MNRKVIYILVIAGFLIFLSSSFIFAQEEKKPAEAPPTNIIDVLWLWGDVVSVDILNKSLVVKYLDYDTDTEKEMSINVDAQTVFENVKSLEEVKPQDTVSVDYIVSAEGKSIAKNLTVEKIEEEGVPEETGVIPEKVGSGPIPEKSELPQESAGGNLTSPETAK
jgi:hypothetical protein